MERSAVLLGAIVMIALEINKYPCGLSGIAGIPHMEHRSPNTTLTSELIDSQYCDLYALDEDTWYRSDYTMTNYCVTQQACGADNPIWMQGEIPGVDEGIVTNTACVRSYTECCANTYSVKVKNCESFTVYCFVDTPTACHQRFCFDVASGLKTTQQSTTQPPTTLPSTAPAIATTDQHGGRNVEPHVSCRNDGPSTPFVILITALCCTIFYAIIAVLAILVMRQCRKKSAYVVPAVLKRERKQTNGNVQTVRQARVPVVRDLPLYGMPNKRREDPVPVLGDMPLYDMPHKK